MKLSDFDFDLPAEMIAQKPLAQRSDSRLLHLSSAGLVDRRFRALPQLLRANDLLVVNDSKVIPARLFGHKESGGRVEILVERILDTHQALAMVRASKSPRTGTRISLDAGGSVQVTGRSEMFFELAFDQPVLPLLQDKGTMPLPPYIQRDPDADHDGISDDDRERYQTVYADQAGSVAAPTAGLHFDQPLLDALAQAGIGLARLTLHVGAGTFAPVRTDDISQHTMHTEYYEISEATCRAIADTRAAAGRVIAVGTTSLRTLESAASASDGQPETGAAQTALFITPGYQFKVVDALITNFHLPRSTLLMLVSAFAGTGAIRQAYQYAIEQRYRFFSYGDAMFIDQSPPGRAPC